MSFPAYEEYKESGIGWLGEVPDHWKVVSIKWLSPVQRGASPRPIEDPKYFDDDGEFAWVRIADVSASQDGRLRQTTQRLSELGSSLSVKIHPGEIFVSIAGTVGKPCISEIKACIHDGFVHFPHININREFLFRIFESGLCYGGLGKWGTQLNLNTDTVGAIKIPVPPNDELDEIMRFLDVETSKIDGLVSEQRRLIELLKEKRQAVISHAVTKGLNPNAPMKPSGIQWLGDVPQHWRHGVKLKTLAINQPASFTNGPFGSDLLTSELHNEGVPVIYIRDLKVEGYKRKSSSHVTPGKAEQLGKFRVDPEDVLIAKVGDPPGFCCTYPVGEPPAIICQDVIRLKPDFEVVSPYFLCFLLNSEPGKESVGSVCVELTRKRFSLADLQSLRFSIPPREEQDEIVAELDRKLAKLDALLAEAERAIELLQERRTALISAAVTGKIDVRGFASQETA